MDYATLKIYYLRSDKLHERVTVIATTEYQAKCAAARVDHLSEAEQSNWSVEGSTIIPHGHVTERLTDYEYKERSSEYSAPVWPAQFLQAGVLPTDY